MRVNLRFLRSKNLMHWLKKKINALELYTIDVILGRRADTGAAIYGACLQSLSWLFNGIVQARWWLYRHRIFHDQPSAAWW